jgi:hypothetical protein
MTKARSFRGVAPSLAIAFVLLAFACAAIAQSTSRATMRLQVVVAPVVQAPQVPQNDPSPAQVRFDFRSQPLEIRQKTTDLPAGPRRGDRAAQGAVLETTIVVPR